MLVVCSRSYINITYNQYKYIPYVPIYLLAVNLQKDAYVYVSVLV